MSNQKEGAVETNLNDHIEILDRNPLPQKTIGEDDAKNLKNIDFKKSEEVLEAIGGEETMFTSLEADVSKEEHNNLAEAIKLELGEICDEYLSDVKKDDGTWLFSKFFALKLDMRNVIRLHFNIECNPASAAIITVTLCGIMELEYVLVCAMYEVKDENEAYFDFYKKEPQKAPIPIPPYVVRDHYDPFDLDGSIGGKKISETTH